MIKTLKVAAKNSNMFELKKETPASRRRRKTRVM